MVSPEELKKQIEEMVKRADELRGRIVRAEHWSQIFATPEEAEADFIENLIDAWRFYYGKNKLPLRYEIEPHPDGSIHRVIMNEGNEGYETTYQRLAGGDVILISYYPDKPFTIHYITPSIGNIAHPFTIADTVIPNRRAMDVLIEDEDRAESTSEAIGTDLEILPVYLKGKPATTSWEESMLRSGDLPQRIGYRLFPHFALEAHVKLKEIHPQLFQE